MRGYTYTFKFNGYRRPLMDKAGSTHIIGSGLIYSTSIQFEI